MRQPFWQRLDTVARNLTPFGLAFLLILISTAPTHIPELARITPMLGLIAVYHWSIYRPDLMPAWAMFGLGLFHDLIGGGPLGANALLLLLCQGTVVSQHRFFVGKSFIVIWLGFALLAAGAAALAWTLLAGYHVRLVEWRGFLYQYLLTLAFYPPLAWGFIRWQRVVLRGD